MFCPKCGTENPETGKFCRSCGTDIGIVANALSVKISGASRFDYRLAELEHKKDRRKNPDEVFGDGIKQMFGGMGFVAVAIVLAVTGMIGAKVWWFWLLIPAAAMIGSGVAEIFKAKRMEKRLAAGVYEPNFLSQPPEARLSSPQNVPIAAETRYKTGDLAPPSVTDGTTRHLEINSEGETMTLPKK